MANIEQGTIHAVFRELERRGAQISANFEVSLGDLRRDPKDYSRGVPLPEIELWISDVHGAVERFFPAESKQRAWLRGAEELRSARRKRAVKEESRDLGLSIVELESDHVRQLMGIVKSGLMLEPHVRGEAMVVNVSVGNNSGILNIASHLRDAVQSVQSSPALSSARKAEWGSLVSQLQEALQRVPENHRGDAELVSEQAASIARELEKPSPRPAALRISASGLIEATKALSVVVPFATEIAKKIAQFVVDPIGS